jgi:ATP-dependent protease ClpP protease subunit
MSAEEAKVFGLVDEVVINNPLAQAEPATKSSDGG